MTLFEMQVRAAITFSGISYKQLGKESGVHPAMIGKFMRGERGLTLESVGKILDTLGCVLTVGKNRFAPRPIGRPRKVISAPEPVPSSSPPGRLGLGDAEEKDEVGQAHVHADLKEP